jgi:broad specificity phosphatase PhoE
MSTIHLVRHGQTEHNRAGQGLGHSDVALTDLGIAQAEAVARRLASEPVRQVFASPLERAGYVARAIAAHHGLDLETIPALIELDVGDTEGLEIAETRRRYPDFMEAWATDEGHTVRMPGGESMEDLAARLRPLAVQLLEITEGDLVVVSHNFALRALLCDLLGLGLERWRAFQLDLASITSVTVRNGRVSVRTVNDTCHLANLNLA